MDETLYQKKPTIVYQEEEETLVIQKRDLKLKSKKAYNRL